MQKEVAKQASADDRKRLLTNVKKWGGFWDSVEDIETNLQSIPNSLKKQALKDQIHFRKVVLQQSHPDPKIFNLGTSVEGKYTAFDVDQLKKNLQHIIDFNQQDSAERALELEKTVLRSQEERRSMIEKANREMSNDKQSTAKEQKGNASKRGKVPKLLGK